MMNPHHLDARSPSPGRPLNAYQLSDNPYAPREHLEMPSSDRLAEQPTVRIFLELWMMMMLIAMLLN